MARMEQVSLMELGKLAAEGQIEAEVFAQIAQCAQKMTKGNKPYLDVSFADAEGTMGLKVWEDKPWFRTLASLPLRSFVSLRGQWAKGGFGMEVSDLDVRLLDEQEKESFLAGSGTLKKKQEADLKEICVLIKGMNDPRIRALCIEFIEQFGERLQRAAAARTYHHARRGGLVEHVAGMMRTASAVCQAIRRPENCWAIFRWALNWSTICGSASCPFRKRIPGRRWTLLPRTCACTCCT